MSVKDYIWRDKKITGAKEEKAIEYKLVDMNDVQLQQCYNHCKEMLYNNDLKNPGRVIIANKVSEQINCCNAELALRWFLEQTDSVGNKLYTSTSLMADLRNWVAFSNSKPENLTLKDFVQVPPDYKEVSIKLLQAACKDTLGVLNHSKISYSFLFRLGVYFTSQEFADIEHFALTKALSDKLKVLKSQLCLNDETEINVNPKGLSEQEFRTMIHLKKQKGPQRCKFSEMSTLQLKTLRDKVLYAFEEHINKQVDLWLTLMQQIEEVAKYKQYTLE